VSRELEDCVSVEGGFGRPAFGCGVLGCEEVGVGGEWLAAEL
jgi:hypothetical protein